MVRRPGRQSEDNFRTAQRHAGYGFPAYVCSTASVDLSDGSAGFHNCSHGRRFVWRHKLEAPWHFLLYSFRRSPSGQSAGRIRVLLRIDRPSAEKLWRLASWPGSALEHTVEGTAGGLLAFG